MFALPACLPTDGLNLDAPLSMLGGDKAANASAPAQTLEVEQANGTQSEIINGLLNRRSVLQSGPYQDVASAVLAANSRAAEADLRAAKLRSQARANNWLPTLGPTVSLTSLGDVVTGLVVDAVLFDNGRKRAERDYAAADVEVAAVTLAQDTNDRVLQGLELYLTAQQALARAEVNKAAMSKMERFEYIMSERVRGGVSGRVDLQIVQQKLNQMRADMASDQEAAAAALSELSAMSASPVTGISGVSSLTTDLTAQPLSVMKAEAEATRAVAEATVARAGFLPSLTASGNLADGGSGGLTVGAANGIGFGLGANLEAIEQQRAAAQARVGQVQEDANRRLRALEGELTSLRRQEAQAQTLAAQAAANYDIFAEQQRAGQRTVPEAVGIFETKVRTEREAAALRYDVARVDLKIAALKGVLVNGDQI
ncbi:TolC family protein [Cognatiyoonia koreensis]|uniref:TolC family protein n=1 Tax=Cognatiyoonia koreensis TaxID=364200 RepID=UPI001F625214|nr:TolC family protein [Cognatiyoonia koreensis]